MSELEKIIMSLELLRDVRDANMNKDYNDYARERAEQVFIQYYNFNNLLKASTKIKPVEYRLEQLVEPLDNYLNALIDTFDGQNGHKVLMVRSGLQFFLDWHSPALTKPLVNTAHLLDETLGRWQSDATFFPTTYAIATKNIPSHLVPKSHWWWCPDW
jgi:hypothetical protein